MEMLPAGHPLGTKSSLCCWSLGQEGGVSSNEARG